VAAGGASTAGTTHTISGNVSGVAIVTVQLSGDSAAIVSTDTLGNFSFTVNDGAYTITPVLAGYNITPVSLDLTVAGADVTNQDFTATQGFYTLSGTISGLSGVSVNLGGDAVESTITDSLGFYSFTVASGNYTLTPALGSFNFSPATRTVQVSGVILSARILHCHRRPLVYPVMCFILGQ